MWKNYPKPCHAGHIIEDDSSRMLYICRKCGIGYLKNEFDLVKQRGIPMKIKTPSSSNYLNAAKVKEQKLNKKELTISNVTEEIMKDGKPKNAISFKDVEAKLILNATNTDILLAEYGDESNEWLNKKIKLNLTKVKFNNELVDSIQVEPL